MTPSATPENYTTLTDATNPYRLPKEDARVPSGISSLPQRLLLLNALILRIHTPRTLPRRPLPERHSTKNFAPIASTPGRAFRATVAIQRVTPSRINETSKSFRQVPQTPYERVNSAKSPRSAAAMTLSVGYRRLYRNSVTDLRQPRRPLR